MSSSIPEISVIMSVYNGEKYLREAIESIRSQTFTNFEFIIIDDGSTDKSLQIVNEFARKDSRIVPVINKANLGLANSLNKAIGIAKGELIARMDADDISMPNRFEKQLRYLMDHPEVGVLGTQTKLIDDQGCLLPSPKVPTTNTLIRWKMCFENPMRHPTIMIRTDLIRKIRGYNNLRVSQDYDLWQRLSENNELRNLDDALVIYRWHENNLTSKTYGDREIKMRRRETSQRAMEAILGKDIHVNWNTYWNNPYYSAKIIYYLQRQITNQKDKITRKQIRHDAGSRISQKASYIDKRKVWQKITAYGMALTLNPSYVINILNNHLFKCLPHARSSNR